MRRTSYLALLLTLLIGSSAVAELRQWSDATGAFKAKGELIAYDGKEARITLEFGQTVNLPVDRLSTADQQYLKTTFPNGKSPELLKATAKGAMTGGKGSVKVELAAIAVSKPNANVPADASPLAPGTHVWLLVSDPSLSLVGVDPAKSKIASFTDNKGTDLAEGAGAEPFEFIPLPDGKSGFVHLHQSQVPVTKSVRATLKGLLHLQQGSVGADAQTVAVPLNLEITLGL